MSGSHASALDAEIRRRIALAGPMPVAEFMELCVGHPEHGYYMTHDPLGQAGDFTTAPEISQMFGELIGLWAAAVWRQMGAPERIALIELGPGRGTMMADALRAARVLADFRKALNVHLVETSPALQKRQQQTLAKIDVPVSWHPALADVPEGPAIVLANEFFDALPINQAVKQSDGWHERVVTVADLDMLAFGIAPMPMPQFEQTLPPKVRAADIGAIFEWRSDRSALELGRRLVHDGGAALVIDYGHLQSAAGDTFQAMRSHKPADPLRAPGLVDLTAHVDFEALACAAESIGARTHGPITQAELLTRLGIVERADALRKATPAKGPDIRAALTRLTDVAPGGMGGLFKAIAFSAPALETLPGFE